MTSKHRIEDKAKRQQAHDPPSPLLLRLAAIREAGSRLRLDPRGSTELLRELRVSNKR